MLSTDMVKKSRLRLRGKASLKVLQTSVGSPLIRLSPTVETPAVLHHRHRNLILNLRNQLSLRMLKILARKRRSVEVTTVVFKLILILRLRQRLRRKRRSRKQRKKRLLLRLMSRRLTRPQIQIRKKILSRLRPKMKSKCLKLR